MCEFNECSESGHKNSADVERTQENESFLKGTGCFMDEALSKTKFGVFNYALIFVSGLSLCVVIMEVGSVPYVLPVLVCDMPLTAKEKGVLTGISFLGMICSSHLWGYLADTIGRKRIIQPTLLIAFLISAASSFVQSVYLFAVLQFLKGFFISGCSATIFAYLSEFHDRQHRARAIMTSSIIYGALCMLVPLVAWGIINREFEFKIPLIDLVYHPWRLYLIVNSLPTLLAYVIFVFLPESPKFVLGQGKKEEAFQILRTMNRVNNGKDAKLDAFEIYEEEESIENRKRLMESQNSRFPFLSTVWIQTAPLFKPPHLFPTLLLCFIQFCAFFPTGTASFGVVILNKMATHVNDYIDDRAMFCDTINRETIQINQTRLESNDDVCNGKLETQTLVQFIIFEAAFTACFLLVGVLINKVGKFPILFVTFVGMGFCGISTMHHDIPLLQIIGYLTLLLCGVGGNVVSSATVEVYPTALRGMAVCLSLMFARLGGVAGSNVAALLLEEHCEMVFYLPGMGLIVAGFLSYFIPKIHQKVDDGVEKPEKNENDIPLLVYTRQNCDIEDKELSTTKDENPC